MDTATRRAPGSAVGPAVPAASPQEVSVCLATARYHPVYAGPAVRFKRYLPMLAARNVSARVFTGTPTPETAFASEIDPDWDGFSPGELLPPTEVDSVPIHRVRLPDRSGGIRALLFGWALARHCATLRYRPDVVQLLVCNVHTVPSLLRLRWHRIPTVYTATVLPDLRGKAPLKRKLLRRSIVWPMQLVDAVVVSSGVMRDELHEMGVSTPIHVIPNGVDTERFRPRGSGEDRARIRESLGVPADAPVALFLGPTTARKGIDLLLESWCRLAPRWPDLHLVVAGPMFDITQPEHEALRRRVSELLQESGARERVHFTGMVDDPEAYFRAADLFIFPSRREGMPNVVPEAMASGLPVVMTPFLGLPSEFGDAGRHYLLADFDSAVLAERIERLLDDPELRRSMGAAARTWTEDRLDVRRSVDMYAELYRSLAARGRQA